MSIDSILNDVMNGNLLQKTEALELLSVPSSSEDFYRILSLANQMTREKFNNKGYVFAQIGLNAEPCSVDCKFCSLGKNHYAMESTWKKDPNTVLEEVRHLIKQGMDDLFLMTTADYPKDEYLEMAKKIKSILPDQMRFVANIGDFEFETASNLREVGFTGAYHIKRLREGIDTTIVPEVRISTMEAIKKAGLELYYCVEPIGPEHSYDEIVDEMIRARDYNVGVMAVMRRIPVPGTPLFEKGQISSIELTKIAAVTRLVTMPHRAMNAHETTQMTLIAGVNQLYAEVGANPRDNISSTENNRGLTVEDAKKLLADSEFEV
ncbi:biotin synthase BioB [Acetivibrio cellulolyticus]|uniref:hypothetical protein n=1 Tax=Acetivibrio cellulolyticus TaxID=35830 RepID=UPI0001E2D156|nr:hypothetical protein [Acetivibrio cellulolyticus]